MVDDAAAISGALWVSYLFVLFYLAVAAGAVTHADLFLEKPVKLPFLGVELPLFWFFVLAPFLFLIVHLYTLVHLVMLTRKAKHFNFELHNQVGEKTGLSNERAEEICDDLRRQLPSNIFVQFLAGAPEARSGLFGWTLRAIRWTTVVVGPVLLMLLFQFQFLPYHSPCATWAQRVWLAFELFFIWRLGGAILSGRDFDSKSNRATLVRSGGGLLLCIATFAFSVLIVTFPGEWQEKYSPQWPTLPNPADSLRSKEFDDFFFQRLARLSLHDWLFSEEPNPATRRRFPFSNTLVLTGLNIFESLGVDDPAKANWRDFVFRARGRDLKGAIFDFADLSRVDFAGAQLQGATFKAAKLEGASFACPIRPYDLDTPGIEPPDLCTQLQGAAFAYARLQGATLDGAQLQGASFYSAQLQAASLSGAALQGAILDYSNLQASTLVRANLAAASMGKVQLQAASLDHADMRGANLGLASLEGASFDFADLRVARLAGAQLQGASLQYTRLNAVDLDDAYLWRAAYIGALNEKPAIKLSNVWYTWQPVWEDFHLKAQPWSGVVYSVIRTPVETLPPTQLRDAALESLRRLDCANPDQTLASCDGAHALPPMAADWQKALENAEADDESYAKAAALELKSLVCATDSKSAPYVLAGLLKPLLPARNLVDLYLVNNRFAAAGAEVPALLDFIMSKDCPVSVKLTDTGRATLLEIKRQAIEKAKKPGG